MTGEHSSTHRTAEQPLAGRRVVLTRPREQAGSFESRVRALGGVPVVAPAIAIAPPLSWTAADGALERVGEYDWITFTSANAVRAFADRARERGVDMPLPDTVRIAAVGPATAAALATAIRPPDIVAGVHSAEALAERIPVGPGDRVLFPCGAMARETLPLALRERGAGVEEVVVYRTVPGDGVPAVVAALRDGTADAVLFASPSAVEFVAEALAESLRVAGRLAVRETRVRVFCIGPTTEAAACAAGLEPAATPRAATQDELIDEVARWFASESPRSTRQEESVR